MVTSSTAEFNSFLECVPSIDADRFGFNWHVAIVPNSMLPFVDGDAIGDVALLEDNIVVEESDVLDGPGCGFGNGVPGKYKKKHDC